ncbi:MAG: hypothetical protein VYA62_02210 [Planctomycetota bacterium]|nr:hypothetical protein [Planctomycetota bacterium]
MFSIVSQIRWRALMLFPIRIGLWLLVGLLVMATGPDQLLAQDEETGRRDEVPPPGSQMFPPDAEREASGPLDVKKFQQGDVKMGGGGDNGVGAQAVLLTLLPYVALVVIVGILIFVYFVKSQAGTHNTATDSMEEASYDSEEPAAEEPGQSDVD